MEMNKESAEKCRDLGHKWFSQGNYEKAVRFYERSLRLYPLDGVKQRLAQAKIFVSTGSSNSTGSASSAGTGAGAGGSGTRQRRTAASSNSTPRSTPRSSPASSPTAETRPYTPEQKAIADRINACKSYYDVLGVDKNAQEAVIKKAYKKLALKLHPDKNSAPGASDAFKKVSAAVSTLTDAEKRHNYDLTGSEDPQPQQQYAQQYYQGNMDTDHIFAAMFGMPPPGRRFYTRTHFHRPQHHHQEDGEQGQRVPVLQILLLLLFAMITLTSWGAGDDPVFSLDQGKDFSVQRTTRHPSVVKGLEYYVKKDFSIRSSRELYKIESMVEQYTYSRLRQQCQDSKAKQQRILAMARRAGGARAKELRSSASRISLESCDRMSTLFSRRFF